MPSPSPSRQELISTLEAISQSQAIIVFDSQGNIVSANENFLVVTQYSEDEVVGNHHRLFVDPAYASSAEYKCFWDELRAGKAHTGEFCRYAKDGSEFWIQAAYSPVFGKDGKVIQVIKVASDITEQKRINTDYRGQIEGINHSQAVIHFDPAGNILQANDIFLRAMGYGAEEIIGKHHSIFCDSEYRQSLEYRQFWQELGEGETQQGEFRRINKRGEDVWIQASYTPIKDTQGRVVKVVKYASDITQQNGL